MVEIDHALNIYRLEAIDKFSMINEMTQTIERKRHSVSES